MLNMECKCSQGDHTLFMKYTALREIFALLIYVDDIIIMSNLKGMKNLKMATLNLKLKNQAS